MTWLTRILAVLNIVAAAALLILAGTVIDARIAWTKALEDLDKKFRDGAPTAQIFNDVNEKSPKDLTRIKDGKVSRSLDAAIIALLELLKDENQRQHVLDHLKVEHPKMAEDLKTAYAGNTPEKAEKIMRNALADLPAESDQRKEAGRVLFDYAFETAAIDGFVKLLGNARKLQLDDKSNTNKDYDRILLAIAFDIPQLAVPLNDALKGIEPEATPAAAQAAITKHLEALRGNDLKRREDSHMLFMIFAAHANDKEFVAAMAELPKMLDIKPGDPQDRSIQFKLGPEASALLMEEFNRYLGPRLYDEQVRLRERNHGLGRMIVELQEQIDYNKKEIERFNKVQTGLIARQKKLTDELQSHIASRFQELAELNILVEEAMASRMIAANRLQDLVDLLNLRKGQYDQLMKENIALEESIKKAEEALKPGKPGKPAN